MTNPATLPSPFPIPPRELLDSLSNLILQEDEPGGLQNLENWITIAEENKKKGRVVNVKELIRTLQELSQANGLVEFFKKRFKMFDEDEFTPKEKSSSKKRKVTDSPVSNPPPEQSSQPKIIHQLPEISQILKSKTSQPKSNLPAPTDNPSLITKPSSPKLNSTKPSSKPSSKPPSKPKNQGSKSNLTVQQRLEKILNKKRH